MKNKALKSILALIIALSLLFCLPVANAAATSSDIRAEITNTDNKCNIKVYLNNPSGTTDLSFYLSLSDTDCIISDITADTADLINEINNFSALGNTAEEGKQYFSYAANKKDNKAKLSGYFIKPYECEKDEILLFTTEADIPADCDNCTLFISTTVKKGAETLNKELAYKIPKNSSTENAPSDSYTYISTRPYGDVNSDGKITSADARLILRYSVELEDISVDALPYANLNADDKISAQDARLALRTSVELEEKQYCDFSAILYEGTDCINGGTYFFYCKSTGNNFFLNVKKSEHLYSEKGCIQNKQCVRCNLFVEHATGHSYNEKGYCINCGITNNNLSETKEELLPIINEIIRLNTATISCGEAKDYSGFFSNFTDSGKLLRTAADICVDSKAFRPLKELFEDTLRIRIFALNSITDDSGYLNEEPEKVSQILTTVKASSALINIAEKIINKLL